MYGYDLARELLESGRVVTCIPVLNREDEEDVAVVALEPNPICLAAVLSPEKEDRVEALLLVAMQAHDLLPDCGLTYANDLPY